MTQHKRSHGLLTLPDDIALVELTEPAPATTTRRVVLPKGPIPAEAEARTQGADDPVVRAMMQQDLALVDAFAMSRAAAPSVRAAPQPSRGAWEVGPNEDAVVLLECEGVYSWRYGTQVAGAPSQVRHGAVVEPAKRTIEFDLAIEATAGRSGAATGRTRSLLGDFVIGKVRGWVFRFVARVATDKIVEALERKKRTGLVRMKGDDPLAWEPINALREVALPADRTPRILLFVHGTFSSTVGSFGDLGATAWGRAFLAQAATRYDAILGYDHHTLGDDPRQNATHLLGRLEDSDVRALEIDAISFSRGGLVLRSLVEYLLPTATLKARVRRAVFVAATNSGTVLAAPNNWKHLIDITTNLVAAGSRAVSLFAPAALGSTIVSEAIGTIGALVKALATVALEERHVPGLAAMTPAGDFVTKLNETQLGQPTATESMYYAITSDFDVHAVTSGSEELPAGLVKWLADVVVDAQMGGEPNDLVVNNTSTVTIDPGAGTFIKDHWHFGANPNVYHTVFFTRKEVSDAIGRWFDFTPGVVATEAAPSAAPLPPGTDTRFITIDTTEPLEAAIRFIDRAEPEYVVARRTISPSDVYLYAFRSDELRQVAVERPGVVALPMEEALRGTGFELHEGGSSRQLIDGEERGPRITQGPTTTQRMVVVDGTLISGVIELGTAVRSTRRMAELNALAVEELFIAPGKSFTRKMAMPPMPAAAPPSSSARGGKGPINVKRKMLATANAPDELASFVTTGAFATATATATPPAPPVTVFASADTAEKIPLGQTVPLNVLVSRDEIVVTVGAATAVGHVSVASGRPLIVQAIPRRNLEIVGESRGEADPLQAETRFLFDLKGAHEGQAEVWVILRQDAQVLLTLVLKPEVVSGTSRPSTTATRAAGQAGELSPELRDYPVLQIFQDEIGSRLRYHFVLRMNALDYFDDFSPALQVSQSDYIAEIYRKIENFWVSTNGDVDAFTTQLRVFGGTLFSALVPPSIQRLLWDARDSLGAIQVLAEEPFIPWELLHLKEPVVPGKPASTLPPESHFLGQKGLVRWFHNLGGMPTSIRVRDGRSRYVVPEYPGDYALPEAQNEIPYLKQAFDSTPVVPIDVNTIQALFMAPDIDHFHFSGHGEAEATKAALDAKLLLSLSRQGSQWIPRYLWSDLIKETAHLAGTEGNRPLIVLNACQVGRAGWHLTSIGGFAEAFISRGAGVFVGSLWSVGDAPARDFSEAFYKALLAGNTLAAATTAGREAARAAGDATWMAYVVYGYPFATVSRTTD